MFILFLFFNSLVTRNNLCRYDPPAQAHRRTMLRRLPGLRSGARARHSALEALKQRGLREIFARDPIAVGARSPHQTRDAAGDDVCATTAVLFKDSSPLPRTQQMGCSLAALSAGNGHCFSPIIISRQYHHQSRCLTPQTSPPAVAQSTTHQHTWGTHDRRHLSSSLPACAPAEEEPSFSSESSSQQSSIKAGTRVVLYKGKGIKVFRILVRMKIAQLTGIAACAVPIGTYSVEASGLL